MTQKLSKYFESNSKLLKKNHPNVWATISQDDVSPLGEIFYSASGNPNLRISGIDDTVYNLHDINDPTSEIPQFLNLVPPGSTGFVTLIGMGLGYTPMALLKERPDIQH